MVFGLVSQFAVEDPYLVLFPIALGYCFVLFYIREKDFWNSLSGIDKGAISLITAAVLMYVVWFSLWLNLSLLQKALLTELNITFFTRILTYFLLAIYLAIYLFSQVKRRSGCDENQIWNAPTRIFATLIGATITISGLVLILASPFLLSNYYYPSQIFSLSVEYGKALYLSLLGGLIIAFGYLIEPNPNNYLDWNISTTVWKEDFEKMLSLLSSTKSKAVILAIVALYLSSMFFTPSMSYSSYEEDKYWITGSTDESDQDIERTTWIEKQRNITIRNLNPILDFQLIHYETTLDQGENFRPSNDEFKPVLYLRNESKDHNLLKSKLNRSENYFKVNTTPFKKNYPQPKLGLKEVEKSQIADSEHPVKHFEVTNDGQNQIIEFTLKNNLDEEIQIIEYELWDERFSNIEVKRIEANDGTDSFTKECAKDQQICRFIAGGNLIDIVESDEELWIEEARISSGDEYNITIVSESD